jgi:hypothetical protein
MSAAAGDHTLPPNVPAGEVNRDAETPEVRHPDHSPPYVAGWSGDGQISLVFQGPGPCVQRFPHHQHEHMGTTE